MKAKKALLVLTSPVAQENTKESLVTDACKYFAKILQTKSIEVDLIDLYEDVENDEFNPIYYPDKESVKNIEYQVRVQNADIIVFFFPIWLYSMPSLLKSFLENIFTKNFITSHTQEGQINNLEGKIFKIYGFDEQSKWKSNLLFRDSIDLLWSRGILSDSGAKVEFEMISGLKNYSSETKDKVLKTLLKEADKMDSKPSIVNLID